MDAKAFLIEHQCQLKMTGWEKMDFPKKVEEEEEEEGEGPIYLEM